MERRAFLLGLPVAAVVGRLLPAVAAMPRGVWDVEALRPFVAGPAVERAITDLGAYVDAMYTSRGLPELTERKILGAVPRAGWMTVKPWIEPWPELVGPWAPEGPRGQGPGGGRPRTRLSG